MSVFLNHSVVLQEIHFLVRLDLDTCHSGKNIYAARLTVNNAFNIQIKQARTGSKHLKILKFSNIYVELYML